MIVIQHFDKISSTYTYILASDVGKKAIIIDPVFENTDTYMGTLARLNLTLQYAIDTHTHADHITGIGKLRDLTHCTTVIGKESRATKVAMRLSDKDVIECDGIHLLALYTPGHTDDSYSYHINNQYLFTGDTLLIGGTGRTDFQNGNSFDAFKSLHHKLLKLPETTLVYPAHDYRENTITTIGHEIKHNPRLQAKTPEAYAEIMKNLNLPYPKLMDVAVPANIALGDDISKYLREHDEIDAKIFIDAIKHGELIGIDLRETSERKRDGEIPNTQHFPYTTLNQTLEQDGHLLQLLARNKNNLSRIILICAYGERSALALQRLREMGFEGIKHLRGGYAAWIKAGGEPVK